MVDKNKINLTILILFNGVVFKQFLFNDIYI